MIDDDELPIFILECNLCESEVEVIVKDSEEEPQYCPMCGVSIQD
jgi:predicted nucleic acid-binding Zn ribbon protein